MTLIEWMAANHIDPLGIIIILAIGFGLCLGYILTAAYLGIKSRRASAGQRDRCGIPHSRIKTKPPARRGQQDKH